jgi:hypothetical protein
VLHPSDSAWRGGSDRSIAGLKAVTVDSEPSITDSNRLTDGVERATDGSSR